ncbi:type VI secretion system baseplate subunit TssG [Proteus myxofaciens]|uniref:ImpH/VasB family protein n=1 Tax=Proteus myxofaciens ATCC 19692 TaxID=1354337 RepID=A0A198FG88_9GAMM|nr:type VI secretion system baseplate subunit TssG [Proteus myxofaciens]OAT23785.1 ImpH/VasB family protein [Proteus myxofaciens ATCC 19692]
MDRKSPESARLVINALGEKLPNINFYRFCQLLEKNCSDIPPLGSTQNPQKDPIRFRPHRGMGFPVTEIKGTDKDDIYRNSLYPSIRTTFLGLYGVTSPLPTSYSDNIAQHRDGTEALTDFLDIFNHRITTQFYRIWRKYSYPATFESGGKDETSQYLYSLIGLGIPGSSSHIQTSISRFLALLGTMRLPTRTTEGVMSLIRLLAPNTDAEIKPHDLRRIEQEKMTSLSCQQPITLANKPVLGQYAIDVNSQIHIKLYTTDPKEAKEWLPDGTLYLDFMALLHVYLGARMSARLTLTIPRALLCDAKLSTSPQEGAQIGRTAVMRSFSSSSRSEINDKDITVGLGHYHRLNPPAKPKQVQEFANYRF